MEKPKEDEMEEIEVEESGKSSKPPVRSPLVPSKVKKNHLKDKVEKGKKGNVDDQDEMKRFEEKSRELEREEEENRFERKRLQKELKELRKKRSAEGAATNVVEEELRRRRLIMRLHFRGKLKRLKRKADEEEAHRIAKEEKGGGLEF